MSEFNKFLKTEGKCPFCKKGPFENLMEHLREEHLEETRAAAGSLPLSARKTTVAPPPLQYAPPQYPSPLGPPPSSFQDVMRATSEEGGKAMHEYEEGLLAAEAAERAAAAAEPSILQLARVEAGVNPPQGMPYSAPSFSAPPLLGNPGPALPVWEDEMNLGKVPGPPGGGGRRSRSRRSRHSRRSRRSRRRRHTRRR